MRDPYDRVTEVSTHSLRVAVFASGSGTTFQALVDHARSTRTLWTVVLLVTDRDRPGATERAEAVGVEWVQIADRDRDADDVAAETLRVLDEARIDIVLLAGYLRLVPEAVVARYEGRMLNTHPALLPAFGGPGMYGRHVHAAVVDSGARVSGPTVHLVDAQYDRGFPLAQWPVPVLLDDDAGSLAARVQTAERHLYVRVVDHLAQAVANGHPVAPLPFTGSTFSIHPSDAEPAHD